MKSRRPASEAHENQTRSCLMVRRRVCNTACCARNRVEQRKQQKTGQKTADMRLPGDADAFHPDCERPDAKNDIDAEPDREKGDHPAVAERPPQRLRRHFCGSVCVSAAEGEETAPHEGKTDAGSHGARDGGGSADHRGKFMLMRD